MNVKLELLRNHIFDFIKYRIEDFDIDASQIADTTATQMLYEIQKVIKDEEYSDFDAVEKIVYFCTIYLSLFSKNCCFQIRYKRK